MKLSTSHWICLLTGLLYIIIAVVIYTQTKKIIPADITTSDTISLLKQLSAVAITLGAFYIFEILQCSYGAYKGKACGCDGSGCGHILSSEILINLASIIIYSGLVKCSKDLDKTQNATRIVYGASVAGLVLSVLATGYTGYLSYQSKKA